MVEVSSNPLDRLWQGLGFGGSSSSIYPNVPTVTGFQIPGVDGQPARQVGLMGSIASGAPGSINGPAAGASNGLGFNQPTLQLGVGALTSLGNLWTGLKAADVAKDQLNFVRTMGNANLNNQMKLINTRIEDRARARGAMEGQSAEQVQGYIDRNRLTR